MSKIIDLTGKRFTRLLVLRYDMHKNKPYWVCQCDCGAIKSVRGSHLTGNTTRSCGCLMKDFPNSAIHGHASPKSPTYDVYRIWGHMKVRCLNTTYKAYTDYGGRGITIFPEWINSFENFYEYIGPRPSKQHSIDRIDNNGNYEPGNVRWATKQEQAQNRRRPKLLANCSDEELLNELTRRNQERTAQLAVI